MSIVGGGEEEDITTTGGRPSLSEGEIAALSDGHSHCLVCYSDLTVRGKIPCGHDDICGVCHLRLRFLHDDKKCPICKQSNDLVIVDKDNGGKRFVDYPQWGDDIGADFVFRNDVGMFFEEQYFQQDIIPLFSHVCNKCDFKVDENTKNTSKKNSPQRLLEDHLRNEHRLSMCRLCIEHKRDFVARLPRMTPNQLQHHLKKGDGPESGFSGHPICEFCRPTRFYDLNFLHQHLHKEHYKCHVCEKQGLDNQWFKNYKSLERHFDKQHFLCHDVQCLSARFIVFENELDLRAHELSTHGGTSTGSTKINLEFRTRRAGYDGSGREDQQTAPSDSDFNYDLDGQAFVPEALPRQGSNTSTIANNNVAMRNSNVQLHPLHVQRTEELRAHAAAVRQQQAIQSQGESFPTLQSITAPAPSSAPLVGWSTGTALQKVNRNNVSVGQVTTESFPALPSSAAAGANAKKKAIKGSIGATRRQFAAMSTSASQPQPTSWGGIGSAVVSAPLSYAAGPLNAAPSSSMPSFNRQSNLAPDNFPSLGPPSGVRPSPYPAANAFAKKNLKPAPPAINSASDFPSMGPSVGIRSTNQRPASAQAPSLSSFDEFPAPPSAAPSKQQMLRQQMLGNSKPQARRDNFLQVDVATVATGKATVEEMKASLGPKKYKELKRLTKDFAQGQLAPEGYVDQSAVLFDKGYADADFWSYLSSLLESCPNEEASQHALKYMTSLRQQLYNQETRTARVAKPPPAPASQWKGPSANPNVIMSSMAPPVSASPAQLLNPSSRPTTMASKKKGAWGTDGQATVVRAKASPGSVAVAAASQGPQTGSATRFMAKEQKMQVGMNNGQSRASNVGKKKKQKDELKALAFGR
jgi:E3 ubiquitin-protein ligase ZNF598